MVCPTCWKLDCPGFSRHRTTWAPLTGLAVKTPDITTLRPAVEGLADEVIVRLPDGHGVAVQHVPEVQQVPDAQQMVVPQHVVVAQQLVVCSQQSPAVVGIGQHGSICGQ